MHYQTYAVIGTGALGGYYGARLQQAGADVHFLLRSDYAHVKEHGLNIESAEGDFVLPQVKAYRRAEDMPPVEVILIALKTTQNVALPELLPPLLREDSLVVILQNGLGIEDEVAKIVGAEKVIGGLCFICSNKVGAGYISHLDYGRITLGEYTADQTQGGLTERLQKLGADMEKARIPITLSDDLLTARWKKLVWNIPYNGLSVVLDARTNELMQDPHARALVRTLMEEVLLAAQAVHKRDISPAFIDDMLETTAKMTPYITSMKFDYNEKRPLEVEAIFGTPLRLAQKAGVKIPHIESIYQQLKLLDVRNIL